MFEVLCCIHSRVDQRSLPGPANHSQNTYRLLRWILELSIRVGIVISWVAPKRQRNTFPSVVSTAKYSRGLPEFDDGRGQTHSVGIPMSRCKYAKRLPRLSGSRRTHDMLRQSQLMSKIR